MEVDDLKVEWTTMQVESKSDAVLLQLLKENKHPVLKAIRKQIQIEVSVWVLFLTVYYSMFDGDKKPFWVNCVFIFSLLLPILHSFYGYFFNKYRVYDADVKTTLEQLYTKLKRYAFYSVLAKVGFMSGLLLFFCYMIDFDLIKIFFLLLIVIIFLVQLTVLLKIWNKRLQHILDLINTFTVVK